MIIEGLLTSTDSVGKLNVAPMGPIIEGDFNSLTLRPFPGSTTHDNLLSTKCGVFHVVDSVGLIAEAAIRQLTTAPATEPSKVVDGRILCDCCRWFEFRISDIDTTGERTVMTAEVVSQGKRHPFRGFNRARHAVIEAAILATRVHLLPRDEIESAMQFLAPAIHKTGGSEESSAFAMLQKFIAEHSSEAVSNG